MYNNNNKTIIKKNITKTKKVLAFIKIVIYKVRCWGCSSVG